MGGDDDGCETRAGHDDAGAVLRAWRMRNRQTQAAVAALLDTTQQHLSQIEKGLRPLSLDQRRIIVAELASPPKNSVYQARQARRLPLASCASGFPVRIRAEAGVALWCSLDRDGRARPAT